MEDQESFQPIYAIYIQINMYLVPETTILKWMFGETTISYVKNWNHPIETTTNEWMFEVPGIYLLESLPPILNSNIFMIRVVGVEFVCQKGELI